ncbi:MAG: FG-GAP repeat protein [Deltaproteobacteria bacterium]|nr:FG-GAP repeat protein [Deltaproteobacteria bacterium]
MEREATSFGRPPPRRLRVRGAVAGAGDVNGDGYGDLIVGTPNTSSGGHSYGGSASVFQGSASLRSAHKSMNGMNPRCFVSGLPTARPVPGFGVRPHPGLTKAGARCAGYRTEIRWTSQKESEARERPLGRTGDSSLPASRSYSELQRRLPIVDIRRAPRRHCRPSSGDPPDELPRPFRAGPCSAQGPRVPDPDGALGRSPLAVQLFARAARVPLQLP